MSKNAVASWLLGTLLLGGAADALAQADLSYYGVLDFSYGRFEPSGADPVHRFNSNSLTASFAGVKGSYGLDGGWTPGIQLEAFVRFQDFQLGRSSKDPILSRNAFVFVNHPTWGSLRAGRLQTLLFDTTTRFNALGNSVVFSPAMRQLFTSGNLEGVQGDFYWNRAVGYTSPNLFDGVTLNAVYSKGEEHTDSDLGAANVVFSRGLLALALSVQDVRIDDAIDSPTRRATRETLWQLGATYNFGIARLFGLYSQTRDRGLDVDSKLASAGFSVPLGPGTLAAQIGYTTADGPGVDRKHTSTSAAYLYPYSSVVELYVVGMDDRIRSQPKGASAAAGVRVRF